MPLASRNSVMSFIFLQNKGCGGAVWIVAHGSAETGSKEVAWASLWGMAQLLPQPSTPQNLLHTTSDSVLFLLIGPHSLLKGALGHTRSSLLKQLQRLLFYSLRKLCEVWEYGLLAWFPEDLEITYPILTWHPQPLKTTWEWGRVSRIVVVGCWWILVCDLKQGMSPLTCVIGWPSLD